jgi:hypothetical protein
MGTGSFSVVWSGVCRGPVSSVEIGLFLYQPDYRSSSRPPASWLGPDEGETVAMLNGICLHSQAVRRRTAPREGGGEEESRQAEEGGLDPG